MPYHRLFFLASLLLASLWSAPPKTAREAVAPAMRIHVIRLRPGDDLLKSIVDYVQRQKIPAGIILTTVGSLTETRLRFANRSEATMKPGKVEIVSLVGTVEPGGGHLHLSVSDGEGVTTGGHLLEGCKVYTTAEIAIGELRGLQFHREHEPASGYPELTISGKRP